jgi:hypothetical protein
MPISEAGMQAIHHLVAGGSWERGGAGSRDVLQVKPRRLIAFLE